jgi:hypothetical protein
MHVNIDRVFTTVSRNLGLQDFSRYVDNWIEWAYEAEKYIGSNETFINQEATYSSTGARASGTITFSVNPNEGDTISLNNVDLTFDSFANNIVHSPNEVRLNTTLALTLGNTGGTTSRSLMQTLSGYSDYPTNGIVDEYSAAMNFPESLNYGDYSINTTTGILSITAKEIGIEGNSFTLESDNANAVTSGLTLTGGKGVYQNQQLRLPDNMVKLLAVRVGEGDSTHKRKELRKTSAVHQERVGDKSLRYYVQGNRLNIAHDDLDEITVVYLAYPTDLRGWPMIKDGHETAVAQYIMWQHKLIEYYNGQLPQYITKDLEKRWYFLCGKARGDDGMPTSEQLKQIGSVWNSMIPLKNNRGLIDL